MLCLIYNKHGQIQFPRHRNKAGVILLELYSTHSFRTSLEHLRAGTAGLDDRKQTMLDRVPNPGDWAYFQLEHINMKDLAYLTAKTGDEFAILRGKNEDILLHGDNVHCEFDEELKKMLFSNKLLIYGHSHPGEDTPKPSPEDRMALDLIGQSNSKLISGLTGMEITFTADLFDDICL